MKIKHIMIFSLSLLPCASAIAQQLYCPEKERFINTGMTADQVLMACGSPLSIQKANKPLMQKIPMKQLIYANINTGAVYSGLNSAFYNQWSLPSGEAGVGLQINVINEKISDVVMNGSNSKAVSICQGGNFQVGDDVRKVYAACGTPTTTNVTYIEQPIQSETKPEVWVYQFNPYEPAISLTFVNGALQSIN